MADNARTPADVQRDLASERERLASAIEDLRKEIGEVTDVSSKLRANLVAAAVGALGVGFVLAGGIGATMRLLVRRGREGRETARFGPLSLVRHD